MPPRPYSYAHGVTSSPPLGCSTRLALQHSWPGAAVSTSQHAKSDLAARPIGKFLHLTGALRRRHGPRDGRPLGALAGAVSGRYSALAVCSPVPGTVRQGPWPGYDSRRTKPPAANTHAGLRHNVDSWQNFVALPLFYRDMCHF